MLSIIKSISLNGLDGYAINVQVDVSPGIPSWEIVGLPDTSIRESKERVRTAIKNSSFELLSRKIVVNLAPANIKKEGSFLDLPMAIGILQSVEEIEKKDLSSIAFIGELSLDGKINGVNGILPMCIEAKKLGINTVIIPNKNLKETSILNNITILGAENLRQIVEFINNGVMLSQEKSRWKEINIKNDTYNEDFSEVKGQENVKRGLEIAAAGRS